MMNNEQFNEMLNACQNPRAVMNALLALSESGFFNGKEEDQS